MKQPFPECFDLTVDHVSLRAVDKGKEQSHPGLLIEGANQMQHTEHIILLLLLLHFNIQRMIYACVSYPSEM